MASEVGPRRLLSYVEPWFEKAFAEHGADLDVRWELGLCTLPHPTLKTKMVSSLVLYAEVPVPNGIQRLANTIFISAGVDEAYADNTVADVIGNFRQSLAEVGDGFGLPPEVHLDELARPAP